MAVLMLIIGFVVGFVIAGIIFVWVMRNKFVVVRKAKGSFDEVCRRVEEAVEKAEGWKLTLPRWEFYEDLTKAGFTFNNIRNLRKYFVCKAAYANTVVNDNALWSAFIPCSWSVYEDNDGQVYIAGFNLPLMAMVMPGVLGKILKEVVREEEEMLQEAAGQR